MTVRWIAGIVCLLYMGVSTIFAAVHHHDNSLARGGDQQCAACAWHHDGTADAPQFAPVVIPADTIVFPEEPLAIVLRELSPRIHPNRGPPLPL
jgi:hypothetical protein